MWGKRRNLTFREENTRFLVYLCRETMCVAISFFLASPSVPQGILQWIFSRVGCKDATSVKTASFTGLNFYH